jgi:hypothetical protein
MKLVLGGVNGNYLRDITEAAVKETELVEAAVAYSTEASLLFDWCLDHEIPLRFWGRHDSTLPVSLPILKKFLSHRSATFTCKVTRKFHAKVIRWKGFGTYIGSANLTQAAWYQNIEAGCFFTEDEIISLEMETDLNALFEKIDQHSAPLTSEYVSAAEKRLKELNALRDRDQRGRDQFDGSHLVPQWQGLKFIAKKSADDSKRDAFLKEWYDTLQIIRNIGLLVATEENRPSWIRADTPIGAQADQFLHAHYYHRTFENRKANYEKHFNENRQDPDAAVQSAVRWWRSLAEPPSNEDRTLNEWAPFLKIILSSERIPTLSESDLYEVCERVHAIKEHARRVPNKVVGLPDGRQYSMEEKTRAFSTWGNSGIEPDKGIGNQLSRNG